MQTLVRQLMIPLEQYPTIGVEATLYQATTSLEKAHDSLPDRIYKPRALLVVDEAGRVVGKLNLWDCLRALEPKYQEPARLSHFGLNPELVRAAVEEHGLWNDPLDELCRKAACMQVRQFMSVPGEQEYVDENATLAEAVHQMIVGEHLGLLVTRGPQGRVVGFLRVCDLFQYVCRHMKRCPI